MNQEGRPNPQTRVYHQQVRHSRLPSDHDIRITVMSLPSALPRLFSCHLFDGCTDVTRKGKRRRPAYPGGMLPYHQETHFHESKGPHDRGEESREKGYDEGRKLDDWGSSNPMRRSYNRSLA